MVPSKSCHVFFLYRTLKLLCKTLQHMQKQWTQKMFLELVDRSPYSCRGNAIIAANIAWDYFSRQFIFPRRYSSVVAKNRIVEVIYQAWEAVFSSPDAWNTEKRVESTMRSGVFSTNFKVFHLVMKHRVECLILHLKQNDFRRMQKWAVLHLISKHSLNINFLCIFFVNYWWVWEVVSPNLVQSTSQ